MDPEPHLTNGVLSRAESERLKKQIHDSDGPRQLADLSHLEPHGAERKSPAPTAIAFRGGSDSRITATPPTKASMSASTGAGRAAAAAGPHGGRRRSLHPSDERQARHPRDEALTPQEGVSRQQTPDPLAGAAQQPTVDFDGLSWPSTCFATDLLDAV
jgi:hypothetical protein